jgi:hypothetical protein
MFRLNAKIEMGEYEADFVHDVVIESDITTLTDTCTIQLPQKIQWDKSANPLKRGDKIKVWLGYDDEYLPEFSGYIREVGAKAPMKIICEDDMFLLKQKEMKKEAYRNITLKNLMETLTEGMNIKIDCPIDVNLGNYRITRNNIAQELEELKRVYGFYAYFRQINNETILYAGWGFPTTERETHRFEYGKNIIDEQLIYTDTRDIKLKVKAITVDAKNKRREIEVGDKDGELRTVYAYNMSDADLKNFAVAEMERFKISGFKGSFTAFGFPSVKATDIVKIKTQDGITGSYLITKLTKTYGTGGYRQKIEIGAKVG